MTPGSRVGKIVQQVQQRASVIGKRGQIAGVGRDQKRPMQGKLRVGQTDAQVMHSMERLVQQSEREETARPGIGNDTAGRGFSRIAGQTNMLNVFPPALQITGDDTGSEVQPKEIGPKMKRCDYCKNDGPHADGQG